MKPIAGKWYWAKSEADTMHRIKVIAVTDSATHICRDLFWVKEVNETRIIAEAAKPWWSPLIAD